MDDEADPALRFFPDGKIDLYGALGVQKEASDEEIRKAYRKAALKYHPDKQRAADDEAVKRDNEARFQQIGYAYAVLNSPARRARFDSTGRTDESMFADEEMDWNEYFRQLWTGEVNANTLDEFKKTYQGSEDERADVLEGYQATQGHFIELVNHVPYMSLGVDRKRIEKVVEDAIAAGDADRLPLWDKTRKDKGLIAKAQKQEAAEETEAMEMAREMGVYDALFGDEAAKADSRAKGHTRARKRKAKDDDDEQGDGDVAALQMLIRKRNENRQSQMDNLIAKLEAESAGKGKGTQGKGKKQADRGGSGSGAQPTKDGRKGKQKDEASSSMPSEEEFAKTQAKLEARRKGKKQAKA